QRLDSTHVISNIAVLTRLGLFVETVTKFLRQLRREAVDKLESLADGYVERYLEREGYFGDATRAQARRRLPNVAVDIYRLVRAFADDEAVGQWESYRLLKRLFDEQCEVVEGSAGQEAPVKLVDAPRNASEEETRTDGSGARADDALDKEAAAATESGNSRDERSRGGEATGAVARNAEGAAESTPREESRGEAVASAHGNEAATEAGSRDGADERAQRSDDAGADEAQVSAAPAASEVPLAVAQEAEKAEAGSGMAQEEDAGNKEGAGLEGGPLPSVNERTAATAAGSEDESEQSAQVSREAGADETRTGATGAAAQAPGAATAATEAAGSGEVADENAAASSAGEKPEGGDGPVKLREAKEISSSSLQSPHDPDATYGHKGKGYEVQVAETCAERNPYQVITGIAVNGAHESDQHAVVPMVEQLERSQLKPKEMSADTGYGSGKNIVACAERGVDLQAPVQDPGAPEPEERWAEAVEPLVEASASDPPEEAADAARPQTGSCDAPLGLEAFAFDDTFSEVLRCPRGRAPTDQRMDAAGRMVWAQFAAEDCADCPFAAGCPTRSKKSGERTLRCGRTTAATAHRQVEQQQPEFKERYKKRSGVESTNAELKGRHGADDLRVRGRPRVDVAMRLKAMALNAKRAVQYHVRKLRETVATPTEAACANA
ncbi:MAG: transposase, partial [Dehalococcoidia bacterium]